MERSTMIIMSIITITVLAIVGSALTKAASGFADANAPTSTVSVFDDAYSITDAPVTFPK